MEFLLAGNLTDATYRFALKGAYGSFVLDGIKKLDKQTIFIDIGANIGVFSVQATLAKSEVFAHLKTVIVEVSDVAHGGSEGGRIGKFLGEHGFRLAGKSSDSAHRDEIYERL